jgi:DNA-binding SARP family transcriptional activator
MWGSLGGARGRFCACQGFGGPRMASHRDDAPASYGVGSNDGQSNVARPRLTDAVTELRRLTQDQQFQVVKGLLADLDAPPRDLIVSLQAARRLRLWSAEYLRVAAELEAAARCCDFIEAELGRETAVPIAGSEGLIETPGQHNTGGSMAKIGRVGSVDGWLRATFRRGRIVRERAEDGPLYTSPERQEIPPMLSVAPSHPLPASIVPEADVAALVLGPLKLRVAGRWVSRWNNLKARGVFQYLLIHQGRPVRRDVLMELQWPEHSHNSARNNLNVALYSLRNTLAGTGRGIQPVLYQDGCYVLNPELTWWTDRNDFLAALARAQSVRRAGHSQQAINIYQRAIQLYRGALFEDDPAGEWYLPEQRELNELYLQALQDLAVVYMDLGMLSAAVQISQLAIKTDPCCESAHRLLMRCFALQHQQQLVSRQYRFCVTALHNELGVPPGVETVELFHNLTSTT